MWLRWAFCLWAALAIAVSVKTVISPVRHTVYPKFAARSMSWWAGRSLYSEHEGLGRFPYSPTFAIAMTPFAVLGHRLGGIFWSLLNIGVYLWGLRKLVRWVLPGTWPPHREAVFLMLAMIGAVRGIWNAQSNALIIGLLMAGIASVARQQWWVAALLLAGPVYLKLWPIAIPLIILVLWPRRFTCPFLVAMAIGAAVPFLTQPFETVLEQYRGWFSFLAEISQKPVPSYRDTWTVSNLLEAPIPTYIYHPIQLMTGAATLGWCLWRRQRTRSTRWLLTWTLAIGTAWMMIFGPAVEYNTYVVLAPMITWTVMTAFQTRRGRILATIAFAMTMILGTGAIERALIEFSPIVLAMLPAGTALFIVWLVWYANQVEAALSISPSTENSES